MTATTPTLTPTTMKNIEDFLQNTSQEDFPDLWRPPENLKLQGGFVPPAVDISTTFTTLSTRSPPQIHHFGLPQKSVNFFQMSPDIQTLGLARTDVSANGVAGSHSMSDDTESRDSSSTADYSQGIDSASNDSSLRTSSTSGTTKRVTKRTKTAPKSNAKGKGNNRGRSSRKGEDSELSPEEEARRRQRRERNRQAAARCRKRRVDHTLELTNQMEGLEAEKRKLQQLEAEIRQEANILERQLGQHECRFGHHPKNNNCNNNTKSTTHLLLNGLSPQTELDKQNNNAKMVFNSIKSQRPSSLPLGLANRPSNNNSQNNNGNSSLPVIGEQVNGDTLESISTPSRNIPGLGIFDMIEGSGLTPLFNGPSNVFMSTTPVSCGGQTRENGVSTPDGVVNNKLVSL